MHRLLIILFLICGCSPRQEIEVYQDTVSWASVLSNVWKMEDPPFTESRLFSSSSGPVVLTGYAAETYGDLDHGSFLEVREVEGGFEATLAEAYGCGAVTWIWSANPIGDLVVEIDGNRWAYSFQDFLSGSWLPHKEPFASKTAEGFNLHFPLLHQTHCRLSIRAKTREELGSLFYQVAWNRVHALERIESFNPAGVTNHQGLLKQLSRDWKSGMKIPNETVFEGEIYPEESQCVFWVLGEGCLQGLEIQASSKKELAELQVELYWDGEKKPALSCPLHMLCGVSSAFENVNSIPVRVRGATAIIRWPMPFKKGARIFIRNAGGSLSKLGVSVSQGRSLKSTRRFCGAVSNHSNLEVDQVNVLTLADLSGAGTVVGNVVQVDNRSGSWWGEGDPLIYLDGAEVPAWRGTGTEDYFGFAWCSASRFAHPLRGQPREAVLYRWHLLDTLPFNKGARFDLEAHGVGKGLMDYSALILWYSETEPMKSEIVLK